MLIEANISHFLGSHFFLISKPIFQRQEMRAVFSWPWISACFSFPTLIHSQEALTDSVGYQKQKTERTLIWEGDMDLVRVSRQLKVGHVGGMVKINR